MHASLQRRGKHSIKRSSGFQFRPLPTIPLSRVLVSVSSFQRRKIRKPLRSVGKSGRLSGKTLQRMLASNARTQVHPSLQRKAKDWVKRSSGCQFCPRCNALACSSTPRCMHLFKELQTFCKNVALAFNSGPCPPSNARTQVHPSLQRKVKDWVKRSSGCQFCPHCNALACSFPPKCMHLFKEGANIL